MRFLVALWDGGGTVPVELGVVRRLVERGHAVTVLADPTIAAGAAGVGAAFRPWVQAPHRRSGTAADDVLADWECRTPLQAFRRVRDRIVAGPAARYAADVRAALAAQPVDVVVTDGALLGALIGAASLRVPTVVLCPGTYPRAAPGLPPLGLGLRPATGPITRTRDRVLNAVIQGMWRTGLPPLTAAERELGLSDDLTDPFALWDRSAAVLVLTAAAFDFPARLPDRVHHVGPILDEPTWAGEPASMPPGGLPLVAVGLSSTIMRGQVDLLQRVLLALRTLPVRAVVTTGPAVDPHHLTRRGSGARISVVRSAPHGPLFTAADVVITHAGHGTLVKALAAGKPTLCLPLGRDQYDNAARATARGPAIALKPTARPAAIASAVDRLLHDPSHLTAAAALAVAIRREIDHSALIGLLESAA